MRAILSAGTPNPITAFRNSDEIATTRVRAPHRESARDSQERGWRGFCVLSTCEPVPIGGPVARESKECASPEPKARVSRAKSRAHCLSERASGVPEPPTGLFDTRTDTRPRFGVRSDIFRTYASGELGIHQDATRRPVLPGVSRLWHSRCGQRRVRAWQAGLLIRIGTDDRHSRPTGGGPNWNRRCGQDWRAQEHSILYDLDPETCDSAQDLRRAPRRFVLAAPPPAWDGRIVVSCDVNTDTVADSEQRLREVEVVSHSTTMSQDLLHDREKSELPCHL